MTGARFPDTRTAPARLHAPRDARRLRADEEERPFENAQGDESYGKAGVVTILAGPFGALVKGKDVEIEAGTDYVIYIDGDREVRLRQAITSNLRQVLSFERAGILTLDSSQTSEIRIDASAYGPKRMKRITLLPPVFDPRADVQVTQYFMSRLGVQ